MNPISTAIQGVQRQSRTVKGAPAVFKDRYPSDGFRTAAACLLNWIRDGGSGTFPTFMPDDKSSSPHFPRAGTRITTEATILTLYRAGHRPLRVGLPPLESLAASPEASLTAIRAAGIAGTVLSEGRLKVDFVTSRGQREIAGWRSLLPRALWPERLGNARNIPAGLFRRVSTDSAHIILPDDASEQNLAPAALRAAWQQTAVVPLQGFAFWPDRTRFWTRSFVEDSAAGAVFETVYGRRLHAPLTPEQAPFVLARCKEAGRFLVRGQTDTGMFNYLYDPVRDQTVGGYNIVRHAGTVAALAQLARRTGDWGYAEGALCGLDYLKQKYREPADIPGAKFIPDQGDARLGTQALAVLAILDLPEECLDDELRRDAQALIRFILSQQRPDGSFVCHYSYDERWRTTETTSIYYPGEAVLALIRYYERERDPVCLDAAVRGARDILAIPFWKKSFEELLYQNSWLMQALPGLYVWTGIEEFRAVCYKLVLNMIRDQWTRAGGCPAHWDGGLTSLKWIPINSPMACGTASRLEGLVAATFLARQTGGPLDQLQPAVLAAGRFLLEQQLDADTAYFAGNPRNAAGCFRESFTNNVSRIDYVQHALTALLGVERLLIEMS